MRSVWLKSLFCWSVVATLAGSAFAQGPRPATLTVIHGINGTDLGLDEALPVDVKVNGEVALAGFEFRSIVGPLELPAGGYDIEVSLADAENPGSNPAVITASVELAAGTDYSAIAHLAEDGAPSLAAFVNAFPSPTSNQPLLTVRHTAAAPTVDVRARNLRSPQSPLVIEDLTNPNQAGPVSISVGVYFVSIAPANSSVPVLGPVPFAPLPRTSYLVYAIGSLENGTLELLIETRSRR